MDKFKRRFTRIHDGYSENRRIPILGKIRLGIKVKNAQGTEYPKEVDYFVCPLEVQNVYGERPTELDVLFPHDDPEIVFPQQLILWGQSKGIKCQGNRQEAERLNEQTGKFEPRPCPCDFLKTDENPKGPCTEVSNLLVMLPSVSTGGLYQISTGSYHSTVELNSSLDWVRSLVGRIKNVPMKLRRVPKETHHGQKKQRHYIVTLTLDATVTELNTLQANTKLILEKPEYQLEAPKLEPPTVDPPDVIEIEEASQMPQAVNEVANPPSPEPEPDPGPADAGEALSAMIADHVKELTKSKKGATTLREINKRFQVKQYRGLKPEQQNAYFQAVSEAVDELHTYA